MVIDSDWKVIRYCTSYWQWLEGYQVPHIDSDWKVIKYLIQTVMEGHQVLYLNCVKIGYQVCRLDKTSRKAEMFSNPKILEGQQVLVLIKELLNICFVSHFPL